MEYSDFYRIAEYGNENWKGNFTPMEIAQNAYDYKVEYDCSIEKGKPTHTMIELCKLLEEDMYGKYNKPNPGIDDMKEIILEFVLNVL